MGNLKSHINVRHLDEENVKWYHCNDCIYKSKSKCDLRKHVRVHLDIRLYECDYCPYKAKRSGNLKDHINAHHLDKTEPKCFKCEQCPYKCKSAQSFRRHRKKTRVRLC